VERAALLAEGDTIEAADLPPEIAESRREAGSHRAPEPPDEADVDASEEAVLDRERVSSALEQARWRRGEAARILGVSPRTLYRWMRRLGL